MAIYRYVPGARPPATLALVIFNVLVSVVDAALDGQVARALWARGLDIYYGQWWRMAGCAVVHADWLHLAFNCYGIWVLGKVFEQLQGWRAMLSIYVLSALGGAALAVAFNDPLTPMLGASGAAYGLMGALLGFFYVKTGSIRGIWESPGSRQLAIWFLIGIAVSLKPGISMLGHIGGFVPGALLGVYYEQRYTRKADLYHHLSAGVLVLAVLGFCVYATYPWRKGELYAAQAIAAYERGDLENGDALVRNAKAHSLGENGGGVIQHLELWRKFNALNPDDFNTDVLRWPLTHTKKVERLRYDGTWDLLQPTDTTTEPRSAPESLDSPRNAP